MNGEIPTLPMGPLDLLVKAALAPPEIARESWRKWRQDYTIDETPWNEVRLLGAVADRIGWLEPEADILPRMKGIQKFLYAQTQLCLTGCMSGMRSLAAAKIPAMVVKGASRVVADSRTARERLVKDLDMLVPLAKKADAFECLWAAGWTYKENGAWQKFWRRLDETANHHAWSLSNGRAEIDLHHFSNSLNRLAGDDDGLWRRSVRTEWRGLPLHVPDPSDGLVLGVLHGLRWSRECNADWIIDASSCLGTGRVDWPLVLAEAQARQVEAILLTGLRYMKDALNLDIPENVLDTLAARATTLQWEELNVYARVPMPETPEQNRPLLTMAIQRCGPAPTGPALTGQGLHKMTTAGLPRRSEISIGSFAPGTEFAQLIVRMPSTQPAGARLVGTLCIMGLILDCRDGIARNTVQDGIFQDFHFTIPRRMLAQRGVNKLFLTIDLADAVAYPPWRRMASSASRSP